MIETLEAILRRALATAYKKAANHPDDVNELIHFLDNMPDKSAVSEVVKTVPIELTPEQIFQLIQAMKDADHYHEAWLREKENLESWIIPHMRFRNEVLTPDAGRGGRTKEERTIDATNKYIPDNEAFKKMKKGTLRAASSDLYFLTTDVSHAHGKAMLKEDALNCILKKYEGYVEFKPQTVAALSKAIERFRVSEENE